MYKDAQFFLIFQYVPHFLRHPSPFFLNFAGITRVPFLFNFCPPNPHKKYLHLSNHYPQIIVFFPLFYPCIGVALKRYKKCSYKYMKSNCFNFQLIRCLDTLTYGCVAEFDGTTWSLHLCLPIEFVAR